MNNKAGRNDPCPCGSGKKFKKCCELTQKTKKMHAEVLTTGSKLTNLFQRAQTKNNITEK